MQSSVQMPQSSIPVRQFRMAANSIFDDIPAFQGLRPDQRATLAPLFSQASAPAGAILFTQGSPADYTYLLIAGDVEMRYKPYDGPELTLSHIRPGEVFGWSAAISTPAYTSSAVCAADSRLLRIRGDELLSLCQRYPDTGMVVLEFLATAIRNGLSHTHQHVLSLLEQGMSGQSNSPRRNEHGYPNTHG